MSTHSLFFGERSLTTVAALFGESGSARVAANLVVRDARLPDRQVRVVGPGDPAIERKLEPEEQGIVRTLIRSHATLGVGGLCAGLLVGGTLVFAGVGWAVSSPLFTLGLAAVFGAVAGMMVGGLISLRPDRTLLDARVETAVQEGRWAVVVHPVNQDEERRALGVLAHESDEVFRTL